MSFGTGQISKADLAGRVESPDRADALIGAVMMGPGSDPYVLNPQARQAMLEMMQELTIRNEEDNKVQNFRGVKVKRNGTIR